MSLMSLIFPSVCLHCQEPLNHHDSKDAITTDQKIYDRVMAPLLCRKCAQDFNQGNTLRCLRCGELISKQDADKKKCHACNKYQKTFDKVCFVGLYQGTYKQLIHLYKFKNKRQLAKPFGQLLKCKFEQILDIHPVDKVVPVPLHISRLRERGYNQALLMLWQWEKKSVQSKIVPKLLIRTRATHSQTHLTRRQRLENMISVFQLNPKYSVTGQHIVLVDDVYTTGATAHSCAQVLKKNGANCVTVLTLARA
ncbi:MAG: ComF family protein [Candidatus Magnetomorum sp.]|nr:ComF family protein [Candidatus Magnetomorum sp.]